jgi:cytochrome c-type biogenesis protein CcmH
MIGLPRAWIVAAIGFLAVASLVVVALLAARSERPPVDATTAMPNSAPAVPIAGSAGRAPTGSAPGLDAMAQRLAARLESTGGSDGAGWELLARSYLELGRHADAAKAFARARKLLGDGNAQLLADYADALAVANGKRFDGAVRELITAALRADPENAKAIELDASAAYADRDYRRAVAQWEKVLAKADPSSDRGRVLAANIAEARTQGGMTQGSAIPAATPSWMPTTLKGPEAAAR